MWEHAVHLRSHLYQLGLADMREHRMLVRVAIDERLDLLNFVVRQRRAADNVASNEPRDTVPVQRRSHVKHWYAGRIMRTCRLNKPRVTDESFLSAILTNNLKATKRERRF